MVGHKICVSDGVTLVAKAMPLSGAQQATVRLSWDKAGLTVIVPDEVHRVDQTGPKHVSISYGWGPLQSIALLRLGKTPQVVKQRIDSGDNALTLFDVQEALGIVGLADRGSADSPHMVELWRLDGRVGPKWSWSADNDDCIIEDARFIDANRVEVSWYSASDPRVRRATLGSDGRELESLSGAAEPRTSGRHRKEAVGGGSSKPLASSRPYGLGGGRWRPPRIVPREYVKGEIYDPLRPDEQPDVATADRLAISAGWRIEIEFSACGPALQESTRTVLQRAILLLGEQLTFAQTTLAPKPLVASGLRPVPLDEVDPLQLAARVIGMERDGWVLLRGGEATDAGHPTSILILRTQIQLSVPPERYQRLGQLVAECQGLLSGVRFSAVRVLIGVHGFDALSTLHHPENVVLRLSALERSLGLGAAVLGAIGPCWRLSERQHALTDGWPAQLGTVQEVSSAVFLHPPAFPRWKPQTAEFAMPDELLEFSARVNKVVAAAEPNEKEVRLLLKQLQASRAGATSLRKKSSKKNAEKSSARKKTRARPSAAKKPAAKKRSRKKASK